MSTGHPDNITLLHGGMEKWSDLEHSPAGSSGAARDMVRALLDGVRSIAVVGPHSADLVTGLVDLVPDLTLYVRTTPDAMTFGRLLQDCPNARVLCCDLTAVVPDRQYDLVLALDDLGRISSVETDPVTWREVLEKVTALVAPDGRLVLVTENELGLHRMAAVRSRFTSNGNSDWSVTETFDAGRPRSRAQLLDAVETSGLSVERSGIVLPTWEDQSVWATDTTDLGADGHAVLGAVTLSSTTFRRVAADPTRLTRAAVLGRRLPEVASGWWLVGTRGEQSSQQPAGTQIWASQADGSVAHFEVLDHRILRDGAPIVVPSDAHSFGEAVLDAAADGDLAVLRGLILRLAQYVQQQDDGDGVPAEFADARPDNLLAGSDALSPVAPAALPRSSDEVLWRALADVVQVIRARGARHPWPSATDDATMFASLVAMAGISSPPDSQIYLREVADAVNQLPAADVAGLIALVDRLTETNKALSSRASWFEQRLSTTERDLQVRTERHRSQLAAAVRQQEVLRGSAEDLRRSLTYRMGNAMLGPVRTLRNRTRDEDN